MPSASSVLSVNLKETATGVAFGFSASARPSTSFADSHSFVGKLATLDVSAWATSPIIFSPVRADVATMRPLKVSTFARSVVWSALKSEKVMPPLPLEVKPLPLCAGATATPMTFIWRSLSQRLDAKGSLSSDSAMAAGYAAPDAALTARKAEGFLAVTWMDVLTDFFSAWRMRLRNIGTGKGFGELQKKCFVIERAETNVRLFLMYDCISRMKAFYELAKPKKRCSQKETQP